MAYTIAEIWTLNNTACESQTYESIWKKKTHSREQQQQIYVKSHPETGVLKKKINL